MTTHRPCVSRGTAAAAAAGLIAAAVLALGTGAGAQALDLPVVAVDTGGHPQIRAVVAAPGPFGGQTLPSTAFTLTEGGQGRPVEVSALPAESMEVALVIDTSGSMQGAPLAAAKSAAQSLLDQLPAAVPVSVIGFGATPTVQAARSTNEGEQALAVRRLEAAGETALYDAVVSAVGQLANASGRRFAVVLSDGGDTVSRATLAAAREALTQQRVGVLVVSLRTGESNVGALQELASATGGTVVSANEPAALAGAFDAVSALLVRQYEVRWQSQAAGPTDVAITLRAGDLQAQTVRRIDFPARRAAPAPAQPSGNPVEAPTQAPATSGQAWAVWVGATAVGLAILLGSLVLLMPGIPRARGLPGRRASSPRETLQGLTERAGAAAARVISPAQESFLGRWLERAGIDLRPGEFVVLVGAASFAAYVVFGLLYSAVVGLVAFVATVVAAKVVVDAVRARRQRLFAEQLADTLMLMAGTLRAGYGTAQAIEAATRESEPPTSDEFRRLVIETRLGRDFIEAMRAMVDRVGSTDLEWVVQAFEIHAEVGGDLAQVLDTVAGTIRERTRVRNQVKVLSAEGVLSGIILFVLPIMVAVVLSFTNPDYLESLFATTRGQVMLVIALALQLIGGIWLRRLVRPEF